jgi:16S rRNA processing protein RimM
MTAQPRLVTIGRVVKPQGRRGEVLAEPLSDRPERFTTLKSVHVAAPDGSSQLLSVVSCWPHKGRFVLKLEGVDSIDAAQRLRGRDLGIDEADLAQLPPGSYYHHELLGLVAVDQDGHELGRVEEILETGAAPVLTLRGPGGELLIPLASDFLIQVDRAAGRLVVRVPVVAERH